MKIIQENKNSSNKKVVHTAKGSWKERKKEKEEQWDERKMNQKQKM